MSREPRAFVVLGFASTHAALDAEALLLDLGIEVTPVPAPAALGGLCGIGLRLLPTEESRALGYLKNSDIEVSARVEIMDL